MRKMICWDAFMLLPRQSAGLAALFLFFSYTHAYSFEWDGFRSGSTVDEVRNTVRDLNGSFVPLRSDTNLPQNKRDRKSQSFMFNDKANDRLIVFSFCEDQMFKMSKTVSKFDLFAKWVEQNNDKYGGAVATSAYSIQSDVGLASDVSLYWNTSDGEEIVVSISNIEGSSVSSKMSISLKDYDCKASKTE